MDSEEKVHLLQNLPKVCLPTPIPEKGPLSESQKSRSSLRLRQALKSRHRGDRPEDSQRSTKEWTKVSHTSKLIPGTRREGSCLHRTACTENCLCTHRNPARSAHVYRLASAGLLSLESGSLTEDNFHLCMLWL